MGFPYFDMELSTRFPYSEMVLSVLFPRYFRGLEMGFHAFEIALVHIMNAETNIKKAVTQRLHLKRVKTLRKYAEKQLVPV